MYDRTRDFFYNDSNVQKLQVEKSLLIRHAIGLGIRPVVTCYHVLAGTRHNIESGSTFMFRIERTYFLQADAVIC